MKTILLIFGLLLCFCLGYLTKTYLPAPAEIPKENKNVEAKASNKKVTSIGGIFFKCKDPKKLKEWYKAHLGLNTNEYGTVFAWYHGSDSTQKGYTQWSLFKDSTKYFGSSGQTFMINYRVENLEALVAEFKKDGVTVCDTLESYDYGKFVHILDGEGNKVELWEPNDIVYGKFPGGVTK